MTVPSHYWLARSGPLDSPVPILCVEVHNERGFWHQWVGIPSPLLRAISFLIDDILEASVQRTDIQDPTDRHCRVIARNPGHSCGFSWSAQRSEKMMFNLRYMGQEMNSQRETGRSEIMLNYQISCFSCCGEFLVVDTWFCYTQMWYRPQYIPSHPCLNKETRNSLPGVLSFNWL